jgi:hypothetical protein
MRRLYTFLNDRFDSFFFLLIAVVYGIAFLTIWLFSALPRFLDLLHH